MERILHKPRNAQRILDLTSDTILLVDRNGFCIDIDVHSNLWFLQEKRLLGKNLFELLPEHTGTKIKDPFLKVLHDKVSITKNFKLELEEGTYYFKCIMHPYDDMVLCQYRDITERSNVKLQLEQANRTLIEIQKIALIGEWAYNTSKKIFFYKGHTGVLCEEVSKSMHLDEYNQYIVEDDHYSFCEWVQKNVTEFNKESISYRIRVAGVIYYMRLQAYTRVKLPDGSYDIKGYVQNITDIQRRINDISTLTHAINNAKESIFAAKKDGSLIFANKKFLKNHGISESQDITKLKIYEIVNCLQTLDDWIKGCEDVLSRENRTFIAYQPSKFNTDVLAYEGILYSVVNDIGEDNYWSFSHDITERLHYEAKIKSLNLILNTTIDNLPAGIIVKEVNNNFKYLYRNRESYNRDLSNENSNGENDFDYYPHEIATKRREEDMLVASTGKGLHWIDEGRDRNGNRIILDKKKIRVDGDELSSPIIISIEWDITELEMMKQELQAAKEKAELSDKLKSAFLANMSHEIRTPLNAIVGFSHIIAESEDAEERKNYYTIVESNNERLLQLINEILDLSKIESGIIEFAYGPTNINNLCKEVYDAHVFRAPQGVKLVFEPSDPRLTIITDKNRVFQVISNLIGNAFKFTKTGSISFGYKLVDNQIIFHVTDTGTGIEPEKLNRVFERFAKLNNYAQGTGLGLSICKTIVERLGGEISVSSIASKGSTFTFSLPYDADQDTSKLLVQWEDTPNQDKPSKEISSEAFTNEFYGDEYDNEPYSAFQLRKNILIAEDEDSNYDLLNAILGKEYKLIRAWDGMEAIIIYDEIKPDLILMDIKMPNLDGLEATKVIRELSSTVPIIIQSAYAYQQDWQAAKEAGGNDFITKPIVQEKLKEMVRKWLS